MKISKEKIKELLTRGVEEVIGRDRLEKRLLAGEKLRVKLGVDPTSPDLHLGHAVVLWKLKQFQDAGHQIILIIGGATAKIGDPSGRDQTRPMLSMEQIEKNAKTYLKQAQKILDVRKCEMHNNDEWFSKFGFDDFIHLAAKFPLARILERDDFANRLKAGLEIQTHEILYPMMQAYDSIMVKADVEIGGTDQKFNLLAGRDLQRKMGVSEQDVMTLPILVGLDGIKKMSKSLGNYVGLAEAPEEMYGKIMSIPDSLLWHYFELCTKIPAGEIEKMKKKVKEGANPRDYKMHLAREIVSIYQSPNEAKKAEENFIKVFQKKEAPEEIKSVKLKVKSLNIVDLLIEVKLAQSKSEVRRLIEQGGIKVDNKVVKDPKIEIAIPEDGVLIQKGKRHFVRVRS